jgi:hypothetical protein
MSRTKQERVTIKTEGISGKSLKNGEYAFWGPEPKWEVPNLLLTEEEFNDDADKKMCAALNWYNAMSDSDKIVGYLFDYVEKHNPEYLDALKKVYPHTNEIYGLLEAEFRTMGKIARMLTRGAKLNLKYVGRLTAWIPETAKLAKRFKPEPKEIVTKKVTVDPKVVECCGLADVEIDGFFGTKKFESKCLADFCLGRGASIPQLHKVGEHFVQTYKDLMEPGIAEEAYHLKPKETKTLLAWLTDEASEDLVVVAPAKERKPRKIKKKTPAQLLKHFLFKASDPDLKIESVDPEDIIGADQLWVYDIEKRKLGVYRAKEGGLTVYRRAIDNFEEETSVCKKLRKPGEIVGTIPGMGKVPLRKVLEGIRAVESPLKGRISEDTILLRVA